MANQERPRKKRKNAWRVVLSVLLVGVVWFGIFRGSVSRRLAKQIAALESQGYPVTLEQLNDWYQLPDGADNAADYYMEAFACRVNWDRAAAETLPFVGTAPRSEFNVPLDPNTLDLMKAYLTDNADVFQWLKEGAQLEHARYPVDFREGFMAPMPWLADIRYCQWLYAMQALLAIEQGQSETFVRSLSGGMALAGSLNQMPTLTGQLVRIACEAIWAGDLTESGLSRLELTDAQLVHLSGRFESHKDIDSMIRTHAGAVCLIQDAVRNPRFAVQDYSTQGNDIPGALISLYRLVGLAERDLCEFLELTQPVLNPQVSTLQELLKAGQRAEAGHQAIPRSHLMFHMLSPAVGRIYQLYARYQASQISAQTAIAVLRYRLKYQQLPENLATIVPEYMAVVPVDPFDEEPIRYTVKDNGFIVYSVDEDGQDNGGRDRDLNDRGKPFDRGFSVRSQD
jgi:hypothetical protein